MNSQEPPALAFRIQGMVCAEEIAILKRELGSLVPSEDLLSFDNLNAKVIVRSGSGVQGISADAIIEAVNRAGMKAEVWADAKQKEDNFWEQHGRTILTVASGICGFLGLSIHVWIVRRLLPALGSEEMGVAHSVPPFAIALYLDAILCGVWLVVPKAWQDAGAQNAFWRLSAKGRRCDSERYPALRDFHWPSHLSENR